jgi:putative DNA primase/helicase
VFADNDESKTGEKAAEQTGLPWIMAGTVGWDANDLHKAAGLFAVVKCIMAARSKVLVHS